MAWLKKNLMLVISGVVALALLGVAIYFFMAQKEAAGETSVQLAAQVEELKRLTTSNPFPNNENIDAAKKDQERLTSFVSSSRRFFPPVYVPGKLDEASFKRLLEDALHDMKAGAEKSGVGLPANYDFTFGPQRKTVSFASETLGPLAVQVAELKEICSVLYAARVHSIANIRRVQVAKDDVGASDYLLGKKPATNSVTGVVLTPYEIVFQGFSADLGLVIDGFQRSSNFFIVRNIDVQTNATVAATADASSAASPFTIPMYSPAQPADGGAAAELASRMRMMSRYGLRGGSRYGGAGPQQPQPMPIPAPTPAAPVKRGPETILDERPLRITMYLESLTWSEPPKTDAPSAGAGRARPAR